MVKPFSVTNNRVGLQTAAVGHVHASAAIVAHVALSIRLRNDAVFCNWKGFKTFHKILELEFPLNTQTVRNYYVVHVCLSQTYEYVNEIWWFFTASGTFCAQIDNIQQIADVV